MSNPGVITLSKKILSNGKDFRIEDNIGEAIHLHYGDVRVDLSVSEFKDIVNATQEALNKLVEANGFQVEDYDPYFLDMISDKLLDLEEVKDDVISLSDIKIVRRGFAGLPVVRKLKESHMYRALQGDTKEHEAYRQENRWKESNEERLNRILSSISENGYPFQNNYMIFFNNQNVIRDGQHRAACLYYLKGDIEVPIKRLCFKNGKYNASEHPWTDILFHWNRKRVKRLIKAVLRRVKQLVRRVIDKLKRILSKTV